MKFKEKIEFALLKKFEKGKCFLCGKPCLPDYYLHPECALSYEAERLKTIREVYGDKI